MISVVVDKELTYPGADEFFSPHERFPEYPFADVASRPNAVYGAVRRVFRQAGLDAGHYGTAEWNPLGKWIFPGQTVFVLCNFVYHRRRGESTEQFQSKCTHGSVIRAVIDYIFLAVGPTGHIRFGNAPLQSCVWTRVLSDTGGGRLEEFYASVHAPIASADLRWPVDDRAGNGRADPGERRREEDGITIDLGQRSLLSLLDGHNPRYRVSDYDPDRTEAFHRNGSHQYVLHPHIMNCDVLVSIPKLKTHEKVGITGALKGCVGAIARKDCLAHHRWGTPQQGGDEFRRDTFGLLACLTRFHDGVQKTRPRTTQGQALRLLLKSLRFLIRRLAPSINGAWPGNDTCWRMAVDIARLIAHAKRDGSMSAEFQRPHLALLDGVVGGEGNGPLDSRPVKSGVLVFADNPVALDEAAARFMGYDPNAFAIIREASRLTDLSLGAAPHDRPCQRGSAIVNGEETTLLDLARFAEHRYRLPTCWQGILFGGTDES